VSLFLVDAFTERSFAGNPAAVCLLDKPPDATWMQQLAAEMNQAETAFVYPESNGRLRLRWFTPALEVDLCGHATLASAHVLWETGRLSTDEAAKFMTRSGALTAVLSPEGILMDFPALLPRPCTVPPGLLDALGAPQARHVGAAGAYQLIEVDGEETLRGLRPDMRKLAQVRTLGVIVTCETIIPGVDFMSRFFAPAGGIDEDPVTGSAHCCLGPFWGGRLHKTELVGYQASKRGGLVRVGLRGERVLLGGRAVTVLRGELAV